MNVADIPQQVREENSIHHLIDVFRMRPDEQDSIFRTLGNGVEAMRDPRLDLMRPVFSGIHMFGNRESLDEGNLTLKDLESLRLFEVEVERRCLDFIDC